MIAIVMLYVCCIYITSLTYSYSLPSPPLHPLSYTPSHPPSLLSSFLPPSLPSSLPLFLFPLFFKTASDFTIQSSPDYVFTSLTHFRQEHQFHIQLVDDDLNEEQELFVLYLNVTEVEHINDQNYNEENTVAIIKIKIDPNDSTLNTE